MGAKKLGFGLMRLPLTDPQDMNSIDMEELCRMVDVFMEKGFTYFDTAYAYGGSEEAMREALVKRYDRDRFTIATKMPTFMLHSREQMEQIFNEELERCGVDYFDYYLMHDISRNSYPTAVKLDAFEFIRQKKKEGKIRNIGFSFHDHAELLEEILNTNPDMDFVQLQINYLDWESVTIQSRLCYETAVRHNKKVIVMEPVKGGTLANVSEEIAAPLKAYHPELSIPSWAIRFAASLENVAVVLSGMSNMAQMLDNTSYMEDFQPMTEEERKLVFEAAGKIQSSVAIACTACHYCTPRCPKQIAIPEYFALYNAEQNDVNKGMGAHMDYFSTLMMNGGKPSDCVECKQCEKICPQHLPVTKYLKDVVESMEVPARQMAEMMMQ